MVISTTPIDVTVVTDKQFTNPIELNRINPQRLLIGGSGNLYESLNQGGTITSLGAPGANENAMVYGGRTGGVDNPDLIFVGKGDQVFKRTTAGGAITSTTALPAGATTITDVAADFNDYKRVVAIDDNQVFASTDEGVTWDDITGNLITVSTGLDFRTLELLPAGTGAVAVGTRGGVFVAKVSDLLVNPATAWKKLSTGLPDVLVYDLVYNQASNVLVAGTLGRGVWKLPNATAAVDPCSTIVKNTNDTGADSLRAAMVCANGDAGLDTISFAIAAAGVQSIAPASALPTITDPVIIDGTTQPLYAGTPLIELNGTSAGALVNGLTITTCGSTVRGLAINRFLGNGIELRTGASNVVAGNFIGTDATGASNQVNARDGVLIVNSATNTIGGTTAAARNVISGNGRFGVEITNASSTGNKVQGNYGPSQ